MKIKEMKELFDRHVTFTDKFGEDRLNFAQFIIALSEAMCCGHLRPMVSQPGEVGSKGGPQNAGRWVIDTVGEMKKILEPFEDDVPLLADTVPAIIEYDIDHNGIGCLHIYEG